MQSKTSSMYSDPKLKRTLSSLDIPQKFTIKSLQISDYGQNGVIFIEIQQGWFVMKSTPETPTALFFNRLAQLLGVPVPQIQYFTYQDNIYSTIYRQITRHIENDRHDQCLLARMKNKLDYCLYEIIQYIPSYQNPKNTNNGEQIKCYKKCLLANDKLLVDIGACLAYDMIINNNDRFWFLWGGSGNPDNILIQAIQLKNSQELQITKFVFIDNYGNFCDVSKPIVAQNIQRYLNKIKKLLTYIIYIQEQQKQSQSGGYYNTHKQAHQYLQKFIEQIKLLTGHSLNQQQISTILKSVLASSRKFVSAYKNGSITKLLTDIQKEEDIKNMGEFCRGQWQIDLSRLNMNYCQLYYQTINQIINANIDCITNQTQSQ